MTATLAFSLPEENEEHLNALQGWEWKLVVIEIHDQLRNYSKHGHSFKDADGCIDELRTVLNALIEERGLLLH
jgi:hypothetical protein